MIKLTGSLVKRFGLSFSVVMFASAVSAEDQMCVPYLSGDNVNAALTLASTENQANAEKALSNYISAASDPSKDIFRTVTKLDSSDVHIKQQMKEIPNFFSSYSGIRDFTAQTMLKFGNYVMFYADYDTAAGQGTLLETVLCTNLCQVSNVMERPKPPEDAVSRYFQQLRLNKSKAKRCSTLPGKVSAVTPTLSLNESAPLQISFNINTTNKPIKNISALNWGSVATGQTVSSCQRVLDKTFKGRNDDPDREPLTEQEAMDFVNECGSNMKLSSALPVLDLTSGKRELFVSYTFANLLANSSKMTEVARFKEGKYEVVVLELEAAGTRVVVLPFVKQGDKTMIDWNFYGNAVGEALTTRPFIQFYRAAKKT